MNRPLINLPTVTVIVPVRNRADLVIDALNSVARQSYQPIELIVVDDGSTDQTIPQVRNWLAQYRDRFISAELLSQKHSGAPAARNLGMQAARGDLLQFLDSDDLLLPDKLKSQAYPFSVDNEIDCVWSRWAWRGIGENESVTASRQTDSQGSMQVRLPVNPAVGLIRRDTAIQVGLWNTGLTRHQDWEWTTRLLLQCRKIYAFPAIQHVFRKHSLGRISDLKFDRRKAILAKLLAVESAVQSLPNQGRNHRLRNVYLHRIRSRCLTIIRSGMITGQWHAARSAFSLACATL